VASKNIATAKIALAEAQANLKIAQSKAAGSKTLYDSLVVTMNSHNANNSITHATQANLKQSRMKVWNADASVMQLRFQIESAQASSGDAQLERIISADNSLQIDISNEITRLQAEADSGAASVSDARMKVETNSSRIASLEASLAMALKEEAAARAALGGPVVEQVNMYDTYKMQVDSAMRLSEADVRRVNLLMQL